MLGRVKMLRGMFVLRGVTTADVATAQAQAEMHPGVTHLEALFTAFGFGLDAANLIEVRAFIGHGLPQF
jgi:hypothetical protein